MKYLILVSILLLAGCSGGSKDPIPFVGSGVQKLKDGDVTCYLYYQHGISCLRDSK